MQLSIFCKSLEFYGYNLVLGIHGDAFASQLTAILPSSTLRHVACSNSEEACAMATGYHLGTGTAALIYMGETSLGSAVDILTSLLQNYERSVPALLLIATPSALTQGEETSPPMQQLWLQMQQFLQFPSECISSDVADFHQTLTRAEKHFKKNSTPFVILLPENIFETTSAKTASEEPSLPGGTSEKERSPSGAGVQPYIGKFSSSFGRSTPSRSKYRRHN